MNINDSDKKLLTLLAVGDVISGDELGEKLGISRAGIWKQIKKFESLGIKVTARHGKGYQIDQSIELLDLHKIASFLNDPSQADLFQLNAISWQTESTNKDAFAVDLDENKISVHLAEYQYAGRGRRGRQWLSSFGSSIMLSMATEFEQGFSGLNTLSLKIASSLASYLDVLGIKNVSVKWPNDVYVSGKKVSGLLLGARGEPNGFVRLVVGLGLNYSNLASMADHEELRHPVTDLAHEMLGSLIDRNCLAADLIKLIAKELVQINESVNEDDWLDTWREFDFLKQKQVTLTLPQKEVSGVYKGIREDGSIIIDTGKGLESFSGGEVSVRVSGEMGGAS